MGGKHTDGVSSYPASEQDLELYERAKALLARQTQPRLFDSERPNSRLFVAFLDGSGQDYEREGAIASNVGAISQDLNRHPGVADGRVGTAYVSGPGTQRNPLAASLDNILGHSADERVEAVYEQFASYASAVRRETPDADITIAAIGYSRGAIEAVMLTRLVDRYGILDPSDLRFGRDANGDLMVKSGRPPLVPPGHTPQALVLFDPVSTGMDRNFDLRPPPSAIYGVSFWARDERRSLFGHRSVIDLGVSEDGRFAGILVPGAHSDVGGGNRLNGLEIRTGNLARTVINGLSDTPLLSMRAEPADPALNVIHRSHQGMFGAFQIGSSPAGTDRKRSEDLCVIVDPCRDAEPRDEALAARYLQRSPTPGLVEPPARPSTPRLGVDSAAHPAHAMYASAHGGISAIDRDHGVEPDAATSRAAAALTASAHERGMDRIAHVVLGHDRQRLFAVDTDDLHAAHRKIAYVDVAQARSQPIEESTARIETALANPAAIPSQAIEREQVAERAHQERVRAVAH